MIRPHPGPAAGKIVMALDALLLLASIVLVAGFRHSLARAGRAPVATPSSRRLASLPQTIVWAWERPEDLRALPPGRAGVSFLAGTVTLSADRVNVQPRRNSLRVAGHTPLVACVRIEADPRRPPALSAGQMAATSAAIAAAASPAGVSAVQVDFDATTSERGFYAGLLRDLRRRLPPALPLSITALASWCLDDPWIAGLPVDEAVPMLFRMGPDAEDVRVLLAQGRDFGLPVCRESVGISTDEQLRDLPPGRRRYVFSPGGWSPRAVQAVIAEEKP
jgi:Protein of unknown function (DUF3142)